LLKPIHLERLLQRWPVAIGLGHLASHPLARFLPALTFTLSEISFQGFRDAWLYAAMPPALFYLFGLIYYNNRRTPTALIVLVFLTGAHFSLDPGG
jgi:hypothetical protein